ncbi:MAG TPA: DNA polymerase III subunit beta [Planctomycetes bacterium]|nr:DNA polymerase III subunit beta [Planctomycetota bacterium]
MSESATVSETSSEKSAKSGAEKRGGSASTCLRFRGDAKELAEAIGIAASVAPSKSPRPVLQNLLLHAHDGLLEATGTDLEVAVRIRVEQVEVLQDGQVLVNASRFQGILRELIGEQVEVSTDERAGCTITTGDARFQVMGEDPEDFPELPPWPSEGAFELPANQLLEMVRRTHFATHAEKTRYAMNGILLDIKDTRVHLVATDGKRLALCERPLEEKAEQAVHVVVPTKGMTLLARILGSHEEQVEISVEGSQIYMRTASALLSARLVQGHFPPYEEVLPKDHDKILTVPRESFLSALRRAALLGTKDSQAVRFCFAKEGLELTSRVPEVGESRIQFPIDFPFEEALEIGFNPGYFSDVLKVLETTEFRLELKDARSAAVVREESDDQRYVYLVMPLNLGG